MRRASRLCRSARWSWASFPPPDPADVAAGGPERLDDGEVALDLAHELVDVDEVVGGLHEPDAALGRSYAAHRALTWKVAAPVLQPPRGDPPPRLARGARGRARSGPAAAPTAGAGGGARAPRGRGRLDRPLDPRPLGRPRARVGDGVAPEHRPRAAEDARSRRARHPAPRLSPGGQAGGRGREPVRAAARAGARCRACPPRDPAPRGARALARACPRRPGRGGVRAAGGGTAGGAAPGRG